MAQHDSLLLYLHQSFVRFTGKRIASYCAAAYSSVHGEGLFRGRVTGHPDCRGADHGGELLGGLQNQTRGAAEGMAGQRLVRVSTVGAAEGVLYAVCCTPSIQHLGVIPLPLDTMLRVSTHPLLLVGREPSACTVVVAGRMP